MSETVNAAEIARDVLTEFVARALGPYVDRAVVTVDEWAVLRGIGRSAAFDAVRRGQVPSLRIGRRVVVPVPALVLELLVGDRGGPVTLADVIALQRGENPAPTGSSPTPTTELTGRAIPG